MSAIHFVPIGLMMLFWSLVWAIKYPKESWDLMTIKDRTPGGIFVGVCMWLFELGATLSALWIAHALVIKLDR